MASRSWNRVELIGNLTRDPELRYTPNGAAVVTFGIATNRSYITEGERKEEVDFHKIVAWNKLAELCNQLLKKGNRVFISGRLQNRNWEGQDGVQRNVTEIVVEDMIVLSPKGDGTPVLASENIEDVAPSEEVVKEEVPAAAKTKTAKKEDSSPAPKENLSDKELDDLPF